MATYTTNYNLRKPELTDSPPDITVLNENFDTIDDELNEHTQQIKALSDKDVITLSSSITVTASAQNAITPTWSLDGASGPSANSQSWNLPNVNTGIAAGIYTIQNLIQQLVSKSHTHGTTSLAYTYKPPTNSCNDCH